MEKSNFDLLTWFTDLVKARLPFYQGISVSSEEANAIYVELLNNNFQDYNVPAAENWILFGNWQFKKPKNLTVQDFYPSDDKLQDIKQWISLEEHIRHIDNLKKQLQKDYEDKLQLDLITELRRNNSLTHRKTADSKMFLRMGNEINELKKQNTILVDKIFRLEKTIERLKNE